MSKQVQLTNLYQKKKMEQFLVSHMAHLSVNLMGKSHADSYCDQLLGTKTTRMTSRLQRWRETAARRYFHPFTSPRPIRTACGSHTATSVHTHERLPSHEASCQVPVSVSLQEADCDLGQWLDKEGGCLPKICRL